MKTKLWSGLLLLVFVLAPLHAVKVVAQEKAAPGAKTEVAAPAGKQIPAIVKQNNVNVRGKPSFKGEVIAKLKKGDSITVLDEITLKNPAKDEPARWYQISLPENTPAFVFADFVDANNRITSRRLNLRAGPGENFSVVGQLQKGDEIKPVRRVGDWIEIHAPENTYAFVAADLIEVRIPEEPPAVAAPRPAPAPEPEPEPEVVAVPPAEEPVTPAEPVEPAPVVPPGPAPAVVAPPPAPAEEPPPRRVVKREGIVRRTASIQAPTHFELQNPDSGRTINYLQSKRPEFDLKEYVGHRVIVTGEEFLDRRWRKTPVLDIETLDLP